MSRFSVILHRHKNTKTIQIQCVKKTIFIEAISVDARWWRTERKTLIASCVF